MLTLSPSWLIPDAAHDVTPGMQLLPAGIRWDAVRTPENLGLPLLDHLRADPRNATRLGPVLLDRQQGCVYWLVQPGATDSYPTTARLLRRGAWIGAPILAAATISVGQWIHLPDHHILTGPAWLAAALTDALQETPMPGHPDPTAAIDARTWTPGICATCPGPQPAEQVVTDVESEPGSGLVDPLCRTCLKHRLGLDYARATAGVNR